MHNKFKNYPDLTGLCRNLLAPWQLHGFNRATVAVAIKCKRMVRDFYPQFFFYVLPYLLYAPIVKLDHLAVVEANKVIVFFEIEGALKF